MDDGILQKEQSVCRNSFSEYLQMLQIWSVKTPMRCIFLDFVYVIKNSIAN